MKLGYNYFFYSNLIVLGVHFGILNKRKIISSSLANCEISGFMCLDIKQSFKELKKVSLLVEHLCSIKGKLLVLMGNYFVIEVDLVKMILCEHPNLVAASEYNFAGLVTNFVRPKFGIPSIAFIANSDRCWYAATECFSFFIPTISLVDLDMLKPFVSRFVVYKLLSNCKSSAIIVFFTILILLSMKLGYVRSKTLVFKYKNTKKPRKTKIRFFQ